MTAKSGSYDFRLIDYGIYTLWYIYLALKGPAWPPGLSGTTGSRRPKKFPGPHGLPGPLWPTKGDVALLPPPPPGALWGWCCVYTMGEDHLSQHYWHHTRVQRKSWRKPYIIGKQVEEQTTCVCLMIQSSWIHIRYLISTMDRFMGQSIASLLATMIPMHLVQYAKCPHGHSTWCSQLTTPALPPGHDSIMTTSLLSAKPIPTTRCLNIWSSTQKMCQVNKSIMVLPISTI